MADANVQVGKEIGEKISSSIRGPLIEGLTAAAGAIPFGSIFMDKFSKDTKLGSLIFSGSMGKGSKSEANDEEKAQTKKLEKIESNGGDVSKKIDLTNDYLKVIADGVPTAEELEEAKRNGGAVDVPEPKEKEKEGFGFMLLRFLGILGMVGAALAGLAAGAAVGVVTYLTDWVRLLGKGVKGLISKIPTPKWLDEVIDALKNFGGNALTRIKNFFVGETSVFKRMGTLLDTVTDALKSFTGGVFTRIKTFFVGETSIFKRVGTTVDTVTDGLKGFTGGALTKVKTFFVGETSIFKRVGTIVDTVTDGLKGFTGGVFTRIKSFFTSPTSIFKKLSPLDQAADALKAFDGGMFGKISGFFTGEGSVFKRIGGTVDGVTDTVKGFSGGIFDSVKGVFKSVGGIGETLMKPIKGIMDFFPGGGAKGSGGIISKVLNFLLPFKSVFSAFARLGAKLIAPLNIIIGIFDAGFETKDAVEKSDGFFASLFNGIIGAIGGFIDGAILSLLDLVKSGISWVAGKLGFGDVEKELDAFSFSKIFNEWLDDVYEFINKLFNNPMEMLRSVANSVLGETITNKLFGASPEAQAAELKKEYEEQQKEFKERQKEGKGWSESQQGFERDQKVRQEELMILAGKMKDLEEKYPSLKGSRHQGGPIKVSGLYELNAGEMVMDNRAAALMGTVLNQQMMGRVGMGMGSGESSAPVIMDNSTVVQNNHQTTFTNPIGQMLPNEASNFVSKMAA